MQKEIRLFMEIIKGSHWFLELIFMSLIYMIVRFIYNKKKL